MRPLFLFFTNILGGARRARVGGKAPLLHLGAKPTSRDLPLGIGVHTFDIGAHFFGFMAGIAQPLHRGAQLGFGLRQLA